MFRVWSFFMILRGWRDEKRWQRACTYSLANAAFLLIVLLFSITGCIGKSNIEVTLKNPRKTTAESLNITVSNVQVINHQIVITGTNLSSVSNFNIKEGGTTTNLQIESKTSTSIVANTISNVTFAAGKVFDFILSNAMAASTFTVDFSLCNSSLGGKAFDCLTTPLDKQVLSYDQASGKWKPRDVNGLNYIGVFDSSGGVNPAIKPAGQYYIISVAGDIDAGATILGVGDWIVSNGSVWQKIDNSTVITSVFGRTGAITASLSDLTDINFGTAPTLNQYLKYNGTHWAPATLTYTEADPTVTAFAKAALPTCGAGQVLKGNGTILTCVTDNVGTSFTGTANRAMVTDGAGALGVSAITDTVLGYLSGATSNIQTQLNAKASSASVVDWSVAGVQTLEPTRLNLTTASRVVVTNGTSTPIASTVSTSELGYLSGVTSAIQTQLNSKLSSYTETDPGVTAFAKAILPICNAGEVLKGNGTSLSCVTDNAGAGAYTGAINRVVLTDGTTGALTVSTVTNTEAGYLSGVTSAIQTQLNAKQAAITTASVLTSGSIQTNLQNAVEINPYNTAAGNTGEFRFYELVANGTNYTGFKSPDLLGANIIYTMPGTAPGAGEVLSSTAGGVLSWVAIPSAPVTSVNTLTGAVTLTTANIAEGTNQYHTDARVLSTPITAPTLTNSAIATSDTVQVSLGKLQAQVSSKEGSLTVGTTAQYYRGDKSFQTLDTLAVPENTNLYFTDTRARTATVADAIADAVTNTAPSQNAVFDAMATKLNSASFIQWNTSGVQTIDPSRLNLGAPSANKAVVTDASGFVIAGGASATEVSYLSGVTSAIQTQLNAKQALITAASVLTAGSIQTNLQNAVAINPYNTAAGNTGEARFYELVANGTNYTGFKSPDLLGANIIYTMPGTAPNAGEVLSSTAGGVLSWMAIPSAPVTSVNSQTGAVTLTTTNIAEGTNLYHTNARVLSTPITAPTLTNSAIATSDTVQVSLGKLQAQFNNVLNILLTGLSTATNSAISATDSILVALGKLQAQVSSKADATNGAQSITASNINTTTINGGVIPDLSKAVTNEGGVPSLQTGTLAARPAAVAGNAGRVYLVNDSGNEAVYLSSGSVWVKIAQNGISGTVATANGGTGSTTFTANKIVVVNGTANALIDGPSLDDTSAVAATVVKRGASGEVYGQNLIPTSTVAETGACTILGAMAKDTNGNILSCQN